jgi:hypothetical protein
MRKHLKNHFIPHEGNDFKPHFVRERNLVGVALLAVAIFGLAFSIKSLITKHPDLLSAVITGVLVDLTNSSRLSQNLGVLTSNPTLAYAAQLKANDMAEKSYFAHTSPEGRTPWYWFTEGGYKFIYAGENLAVNFVDSEDVVRAWMNSEGHRANILNDKFTEIGIALASGKYNGQDTIYVVQLFGQPAPQSVIVPPIVVKEESLSVPVLAEEINVSGAVASTENVEVLAESEMFIAVQNNDYVEVENVKPVSAESVSQSGVVEKALASPKMALKVVYLAIGGIVLLALILFVVIEPRHQHPKNILYVILLLVLIFILFYLSSVRLFPQILVE